MSKCNEVLNHIYEYLNNHDVTPELSGEIKQHLDACRCCFDRYEFEQKLLARLKQAGCCSCPDGLKQKIKTIMDAF